LKRETVSTPVRPLSLLIDENGVKNIDLLKVDVEGGEAEVLRGIREDHWPIIRQAVVEVHDGKNSLPVAEEMLAHTAAPSMQSLKAYQMSMEKRWSMRGAADAPTVGP
jgi:hypothetical protein